MGKYIDMRNVDLEDYDYSAEESVSRARSAKKVKTPKAAKREDQTRTAEAKAASQAARYTDEQIIAKKAANKEIAEKKALQNKAAIAAKKREENGSSYRFKKSYSDSRRSR